MIDFITKDISLNSVHDPISYLACSSYAISGAELLNHGSVSRTIAQIDPYGVQSFLYWAGIERIQILVPLNICIRTIEYSN